MTEDMPDNELRSTKFIAFKNDDRLCTSTLGHHRVCMYICVCAVSSLYRACVPIYIVYCQSNVKVNTNGKCVIVGKHSLITGLVHTNELMLPRHANNRSGEPNQTHYMCICMCVDALFFLHSFTLFFA